MEGDDSVFDVTPSEGVNEASFLIRVKNSVALDYERIQEFNFRVRIKIKLMLVLDNNSSNVYQLFMYLSHLKFY